MSGESPGSGEPGGSAENRKEDPPDEAEQAAGDEAEKPSREAPVTPGEEQAGPEDDGGGTDEELRRPISVRDLMPSPPSRPSRRPPERAERPERATEPEPEDEGETGALEPEEAPEGPTEEPGAPEAAAGEPAAGEPGEPAGAASVPTPVRVAMDAPPPGDSRPREELPSRRFEVEGEEWIVRISGRTITGTRPDAGALLMHLSFFRAEDPEDPRRRLIAVDRPLDALYDEDLRELYERSRPADQVGSGSE